VTLKRPRFQNLFLSRGLQLCGIVFYIAKLVLPLIALIAVPYFYFSHFLIFSAPFIPLFIHLLVSSFPTAFRTVQLRGTLVRHPYRSRIIVTLL
jgi:hypothetical protein